MDDDWQRRKINMYVTNILWIAEDQAKRAYREI
jgi:ribosomal protein L15E